MRHTNYRWSLQMGKQSVKPGGRSRKWSAQRRVDFATLVSRRKANMMENFRRIVRQRSIDYLDIAKDGDERRMAQRIHREGISRGAEQYLERFAAQAGIDDFRVLYHDPATLSLGAAKVLQELAEIEEVLGTKEKTKAADPAAIERMRRVAQFKLAEVMKSDDHVPVLLKVAEQLYEQVDPTRTN